ncbi:nucleoside/nucleotide kinase family protein [Acidithiobacillus ferridurans]|uniref:Uncharacterized protein n=1 Tax=Acidithiobacillus ferridurans TaxID=1232575 RepID=A0A8X8GB72_ACIFI|nr:hypothetical protein [Acidithiobacillus ferridurans]MBU2715599.1 hypothetical protein [Acidithiobacillus ferridurans]MBU2722911.1 hypothetical protein [Acidithiobacillus ferridurans]MBU2728197.1 hypothetical protein [Acidithiobacillus ferridurans]
MIVGFTGPAGCGKDTAADILVSTRGFRKESFATNLYREVSDAFGVSVDRLSNRATKELPMVGLEATLCDDLGFVEVLQHVDPEFDWHKPYSPRQILQWWGTDYRREQDEDYWVRPVRCRVLAAQQQDRILRQEKSWAFADVRRRNEADLAYELSGSVPGALVVVERDVEAVAKHKTEAFWATCTPDYRLDNRHDLDQTRSNLSAILDAHIAAQKRLIG